MSRKDYRFVGLLVLCFVVVNLSGCSEHAEKSDPTSPLASISSANVVGSSSAVAKNNLPSGFVDVFDVTLLPTDLAGAFLEPDGRAILATYEQGFLCFGQYAKDYPGNPLRAVFRVLIDNNTADNNDILILDVYNRLTGSVLAKRVIARRDFLNAQEFSLFTLDFIPPTGQYELEFRMYYLGGAYILANKIAVINPAQVSMIQVETELGHSVESQTEPVGGISADPTPVPTQVPTPAPTSTPAPAPSNSDYCTGNEILCLAEMTAKTVAQSGGSMTGGSFANRQYLSTSNGGIVFPITLDIGRSISIEFELEGNIANWQRSEHSGGKVSLLTLEGSGNYYYMALQRMPEEYRGGGVFRIILGDRKNILDQGGAFLITHAALAGAYSMENWGSEPHEFKVLLDGNRCQLNIDSFSSNFAAAPYSISGQRRINLVIGNREPGALGRGEGAVTRFNKFKVQYQ